MLAIALVMMLVFIGGCWIPWHEDGRHGRHDRGGHDRGGHDRDGGRDGRR
jgi:hypothetical protein